MKLHTRTVRLIDTTLREGQQHGIVSFSSEQALFLAKLLDRFQIDILEVGHPAVSEQDRTTARLICSAGLKTQTLAHARATMKDVQAAMDVGAVWVGIFAGINDTSLHYKIFKNRKYVMHAIRNSIALGKQKGLLVRFTCEDASRTPFPLVLKSFETAIDAGADRISFADTVGVLTPSRLYDVVMNLTKRFGQVIHVHCHNDFGLATSNTLASFEGGAVGLDVSIDGIGERSGIAPLAEVSCALTKIYKVKNPWRLDMLTRLSSELRSFLPTNEIDTRPIIGRYAFAHKAGIHIAAQFHDNTAYEPILPSMVGQRSRLILSRLVGRRALLLFAKHEGRDNYQNWAERFLCNLKKMRSRCRIFIFPKR